MCTVLDLSRQGEEFLLTISAGFVGLELFRTKTGYALDGQPSHLGHKSLTTWAGQSNKLI